MSARSGARSACERAGYFSGRSLGGRNTHQVLPIDISKTKRWFALGGRVTHFNFFDRSVRPGVLALLNFYDRRGIPKSGERLGLRRVEPHGQIEWPLRRRQPVTLPIAAGIFILEIKRQ